MDLSAAFPNAEVAFLKDVQSARILTVDYVQLYLPAYCIVAFRNGFGILSIRARRSLAGLPVMS